MLVVIAYLLALSSVAYYAFTHLKSMQGLSELLVSRPKALQEGLKWLPSSTSTKTPPTTDDEASTSEGVGDVVPGLWNLGGNACFLNSSLQALVSIPSFRPFLASIRDLSRSTSTSAPVTHALLTLFDELNKASTSQRTLKPTAVIHALHETVPNQSRTILNSDQQDAQEFFVLLLAAVLEELQKMEKVVKAQALAEEGLSSVDRKRSQVSLRLLAMH
jgi:ubiquitin C-terminal hydrolase